MNEEKEREYVEEIHQLKEEIKTLKSELEKSNTQNIYKDIVENVNIGIFISNSDGQFKYANKTVANIGGYDTAEEFLKIRAQDLYVDLSDREKMINSLQEEGSVKELEVRSRKKDGTIYWISLNALLHQDDKGNREILGFVQDITQRKQYEKELQESKFKYKELNNFHIGILNHSQIGIVRLDKYFCIQYSNPKMKEIMGVPDNEETKALGIDLRKLPSVVNAGISEELNCILDGIDYNIEIPFTSLYGKNSQIQFKISPIIEDKEFKGAVLLASDITERKNNEYQLKEKEEKLRKIFEASPYAISIADKDFKIVECNNAAYMIHGFDSKEEYLGKFAFELIAEEDIRKAEKNAIRNLVQSTMFYQEYTLLKKNGEKFIAQMTSTTLLNEQNEAIGYLAIFHDISKQKEAENAIKESEDKFRTIFNYSADAMFLNDLSGRIVSANNQACVSTGYSKNELLNMSIKNIDPDFDKRNIERDHDNEFSEKYYEQNNIIKLEADYIKKNGTIFPVELTLVSIKIKNETFILSIARDLSERKKAEKALKESEEKLRNIIENSNNLFYSHNTDNILTYLSPQSEMILGYKPDELMINWTNLITDNPVNETALKSTEMYIQTGKQQPSYELELRHKSGKKIWVSANESPVIKDGKVVSIVGALTDITDKKIFEMKLKESEKKYRELTEHSLEIIYRADTDGNITYMNKRGLQIFDVTEEEIINQPFSPNIYPEDLNAVFKAYKKMLETGEPVKNYECRFVSRRGKGRIFSVIQNVTTIKDSDGKIIGTQGSAIDISELKESEQKFYLAFQLNPDPVSITELMSGKIIDINPGFIENFEYSREELIGNTTTDLNIWADPNQRDEMKKTIITNGVIDNLNIQVRTKSGNIRECQFSSRIIVLNNERYLFSTAHDITDLVKNQKIIEQALEQAQKSDRLKSAFLANMSHEIRTPLNGILGFTEIMLHDKDLDKIYIKNLNSIKNSGKHLLELINDVLELSKIEAGEIYVKKETINIEKEILTCIYTARVLLSEKNEKIELIFEYDKNIPEKIVTDSLRIRQIIDNLLCNAIKFTSKGTVEMNVRYEPENILSFSISDTGKGIANDKLNEIFMPFVQEDEHIAAKYGGTGLGLSITKKLVEILGGKISVVSEKNKGTEFSFSIPFELASENDIDISKVKITSFGKRKSIKILIAEDNKTNIEFMESLMDLHKLDATFVENGLDAIEYYKNNQDIDLILMDIRMPDLDGIETMRIIRSIEKNQKRKHIPIVALTAAAMPEDIERGMEAGFYEYLTKPVDINKLLSVIDELDRLTTHEY